MNLRFSEYTIWWIVIEFAKIRRGTMKSFFENIVTEIPG